MATKLQIYNKALQLLGTTKITSTSEAVAQRYEMDTAWGTCVLDVFAAGFWNFATETVTLANSGSPISGYAYRYALPSDTLRIVAVSTNVRFSVEADYRVEGSYIYGQASTLYMRHVSSTLADDSSVADWPPMFVEALAARLAAEAAYKLIASPAKSDAMWGLYERRLADGLARDTLNQARQHRSPTGGLAMMAGPVAQPQQSEGG